MQNSFVLHMTFVPRHHGERRNFCFYSCRCYDLYSNHSAQQPSRHIADFLPRHRGIFVGKLAYTTFFGTMAKMKWINIETFFCCSNYKKDQKICWKKLRKNGHYFGKPCWLTSTKESLPQSSRGKLKAWSETHVPLVKLGSAEEISVLFCLCQMTQPWA